MAEAQAVYDRAQDDFERAQALFEKRAITRSDLVAARTDKDVAVARLASAKLQLDKSRLDAPWAGQVAAKRVEVGDYVVPGQAMVELVDVDPLKVKAPVPASDVPFVEVGAPVTIRVSSLGGEELSGKVVRLGAELDPGARTLDLEAEIPNPDGRLRPGMLARIRIPRRHLEGALLVPLQALIDLEDRKVVYVVEGDAAARRTVTLGPTVGDRIVVEEGLAPGDRVIVQGQDRVAPGERVEPVQSSRAGPSSSRPRRARRARRRRAVRIIDFSIAKRATIFFLMAAAAVAGINAYRSLPREAFPDIDIPLVIVYVRYPGAAPEDVESQITDPLERELQGLDGLDTLTSTSEESVSVVTVEFVSGTDIDDALQKVRDRVDRAKSDFPDEAKEPVLQEIQFSDIPIVQVNLAGDVGPAVLKQLGEDLQDAIEATPGVLRANLIGGLEREVKVDVDPERLRLYDLSLQNVIDAIGDENVSIPGGDMDLGDQSYAVRVPGEVEDPLAIGKFVIKTRGGSPIYVNDVAKVSYGFKDRTSYARINGQEAVALTIQKRQGTNVVDVVDRVREVVAEKTADWPDSVQVVFLADLSKDVATMVHDLENNILSGLVLVVLVLMFALGFRNSLFVGVAIPFSMMIAFFILQLAGITLNNVVLFSLVLAVGMLVDNAVVVIENNYRHMQEGQSRTLAARIGTHEVGAAILVSTLTTVAAFGPLLFWPGVVGDFMVYMPITVSIVLLASLLVALTVNPVLSATFMRLTARERERLEMPHQVDQPIRSIGPIGSREAPPEPRTATTSPRSPGRRGCSTPSAPA